MYTGKIMFAQLMEFVPWTTFNGASRTGISTQYARDVVYGLYKNIGGTLNRSQRATPIPEDRCGRRASSVRVRSKSRLCGVDKRASLSTSSRCRITDFKRRRNREPPTGAGSLGRRPPWKILPRRRPCGAREGKYSLRQKNSVVNRAGCGPLVCQTK
jgi:hypothetical protein